MLPFSRLRSMDLWSFVRFSRGDRRALCSDTATTVLYIRLLVTIDRTSTELSKSVEIYAHVSTRKGSSAAIFGVLPCRASTQNS